MAAVRRTDFLLDLLDALANVFGLILLVVPDAPHEVRKGLLEQAREDSL